MTDKVVISVSKNNQEVSRIETSGYLILYLDRKSVV